MNRDDGLLYLLAVCLMMTLIMLLRTPPPKRADVLRVTKQEMRNA